MLKDFDKWNEIQKNVNKRPAKLFKERDIWWCYWGVNIGFEQDGNGEFFLRPVLIYKKLSNKTCLVIPLTTSPKKHKFRKNIGVVKKKENRIILDQIKTIDSRRLIEHIDVLSENLFEIIRKSIRSF